MDSYNQGYIDGIMFGVRSTIEYIKDQLLNVIKISEDIPNKILLELEKNKKESLQEA